MPCELCQRSALPSLQYRYNSYVATGEVTTLEHELGDDTVELGAGVAEALLAGSKGTEVLSGLCRKPLVSWMSHGIQGMD